MNGFFCVNKEFGVSSAKAVWLLKKKLNIQDKIGHMGTLDPDATGVLVIGVGRANRLFDIMLKKRKTYVATFDFGYETETLDLESDVIVKKSENVPSLEEIKKYQEKMLGKTNQIAPAFSAKNINGTRAYVLAREGKEINIKPHEVEIFKFEVLKQVSNTSFSFLIECSGGTYIRSLCRDFACVLNSCATMTELKRTKCGDFSIENSKKIDDISEKDILPCDYALSFLEEIKLTSDCIQKIKNGLKIKVEHKQGFFKLYDKEVLIGICRVDENGFASIPTWLI